MFWSHGLLHTLLCHSAEYSSKRNKQQARTAPSGLLEFPAPIITRQITLVTQVRRPYFRQLSAHPRGRRALPQKRQALRFLLAAAAGAHTHSHVDTRVGVHAVAGDHGTELESVRIPSRTSQTCCLRRPVCLATPYYDPTRLKSIKFDRSSILSSLF